MKGRRKNHLVTRQLVETVQLVLSLIQRVRRRPMRNLRRVDHETSSTHCWRVMIQRQSQLYRRNFSDGPHGGSEQALRAAQQYQDRVIADHPPLVMPDYCAILKKNNRSGISGLTRVERWERSKDRRYRRVSGRCNGRSGTAEPNTGNVRF